MLKEKKQVALMSVFAAVGITGFKLVVGLLTGSLGILSEALHSALDMVAAVITYFSVRMSDKPADKDHNFGHGKIENMSALIETFLLLITSIWIIYEAVHRLTTRNTIIEVNAWSYIVVILSIVVDFSRARALMKVAKKYNSQALEADALHFATDIWSSAVVLFGLISYQFFGWYEADSIAAISVAAIVLHVSYKMGRKSIDALLDKAPADAKEKVLYILSQYPEITKYHSLKARTSGADTFIKVNLHFPAQFTLLQVHQICDCIEIEVKKVIPRSEIDIHPEPDDYSHLQSEKEID